MITSYDDSRNIHEGHIIRSHDSACQLVHVIIRKATKGDVAQHIAPGLILVTTDGGARPQATEEMVKFPYSVTPEENYQEPGDLYTPEGWLAPLPSII